MTITLYSNLSEKTKLDKTLSQLAQLTGTLRDESSVTDAVILMSDIDAYISTANYAYIAEFGRYYFITAIDAVKANLWRVHMHVDVLSTYKVEIRSSMGIVERNEQDYDLLLNDGMFVTQQKPRIATFAFPQGFNTWDFVLACAGTADQVEPSH